MEAPVPPSSISPALPIPRPLSKIAAVSEPAPLPSLAAACPRKALPPSPALLPPTLTPAAIAAALTSAPVPLPPGSASDLATTNAGDVRQTMINLLLKDVSHLGLSAAHCTSVVDAIGCNRFRFRSVRWNLKHNAAVAEAFATDAVDVGKIADLSAFSKPKEQSI